MKKYEISIFLGIAITWVQLICGYPMHAIYGILMFILILLMTIFEFLRIK